MVQTGKPVQAHLMSDDSRLAWAMLRQENTRQTLSAGQLWSATRFPDGGVSLPVPPPMPAVPGPQQWHTPAFRSLRQIAPMLSRRRTT